MNIVTIIVTLLIVGFVCWLIQTAPIPIHPWIKSAIMGIVFIVVLLWLLNSAGLNTGINLRLK